MICRYFGEPIDDTDNETLKRYCDGMCDVRENCYPVIPSPPLLKTSQVCKYPDKVKRRKMDLSAEDYVSSQAPVLGAQTLSDEEGCDYPNQRTAPTRRPPSAQVGARPSQSVTANSNDSWRTSFREDNDDNRDNGIPTARLERLMTAGELERISSGSHAGGGADGSSRGLKRAGTYSHASSKRAKKTSASSLYTLSSSLNALRIRCHLTI